MAQILFPPLQSSAKSMARQAQTTCPEGWCSVPRLTILLQALNAPELRRKGI
jgi:hypothetical protein